MRQLLDAVPPYFSQAVITRDRTTATLAFGIRLMPLDEQQALIDDMRSRLNPPKGDYNARLELMSNTATGNVMARARPVAFSVR